MNANVREDAGPSPVKCSTREGIEEEFEDVRKEGRSPIQDWVEDSSRYEV